jgi:hypothetical protein
MIVISVAAAVITYIWITGYLGGTMSNIDQQTDQMQISIDAVSSSSTTSFAVVVRNTGDIIATVDAIYVGTSTSNLVAATGVTSADIAVSATGSFSGTYSTGFVQGTTYVIKVVCSDGQSATASFSP